MRFLRFFYKIKITGLIILLICVSVNAQQTHSKLKIAKALERNYDYSSALALYKDLYETNKNDNTVIQGIISCYSGLQEYENLIDFLAKLTKQFPHRLSYQIDLGKAYFLNDNKEQAIQIWHKLIDTHHSNINVYRQVAGAMISLRLFDEAIFIYKQALDQVKDQSNVHIEIANIYKAQLAYEKATQHYLYFYQENPRQKAFVQREILKLTDSRDHIYQIINVINDYLSSNESSNEIKEILADLYIKEKRYTESFKLYQELENTNKKGNYLQKFALNAFQNKAYDFAIDAYELIRQKFSQTPQSVAAQFQIAQCRALRAGQYREAGDETSAAKEMAAARMNFEVLLQTDTKSSFVSDSYIRLGDIAFEFYFDLDQAEMYYQKYLSNPQGSVSHQEVVLKLADVNLVKNNLPKALTLYSGIKHKSYQTQAEFNKLNIVYYQGRFSVALKGLTNLLNKIGSKHILTNDILARIKLIQNYQTDSTSLAQFAHAELMNLQHKRTESVNILIDLFDKKVNISPRAGRKAVQLLFLLNRYEDAKNLLLSHQESFPDNTFNDEVLFYLAESEEFLGNTESAIKRYKELLLKYPNSLYTFNARERARKLTEKVNSEQI